MKKIFILPVSVVENLKLIRELQLEDGATASNPSNLIKLSILNGSAHEFVLEHGKLWGWLNLFDRLPKLVQAEFESSLSDNKNNEDSALRVLYEQSEICFLGQRYSSVLVVPDDVVELDVSDDEAKLTREFDPEAYKKERAARRLDKRFENLQSGIDKAQRKLDAELTSIEERKQEIAEMQAFVDSLEFSKVLDIARARRSRQSIILPIKRSAKAGEDVKEKLLELGLLTAESELTDESFRVSEYDKEFAAYQLAFKKLSTYGGSSRDERRRRNKKLARAQRSFINFVSRVLCSWMSELYSPEVEYQKKRATVRYFNKTKEKREQIQTVKITELQEDLKLAYRKLEKAQTAMDKKNINVAVKSSELNKETEFPDTKSEDTVVDDNVAVKSSELNIDPDFDSEQGIHFSCNRQELLKTLKSVQRVMRKVSMVPYDSYIHFNAEFGYVGITGKVQNATEMECLQGRVEPIEMEGTFGLCPGDRLMALLISSNEEVVELVIDTERVEVILGKSKTEIVPDYQNVKFEIPSFDESLLRQGAFFYKKEIIRALDETFFASGDNPAYLGNWNTRAIKIERNEEGEIWMYALDGHRLAASQIFGGDIPENLSITVEKSLLKLLYDLIKDEEFLSDRILFAEQKGEELDELEKLHEHREFLPSLYAFSVGDQLLITQESIKPFPSLDKIFETERKNLIIVKSDELKEIIKLSNRAITKSKDVVTSFAVKTGENGVNLHLCKSHDGDKFESSIGCVSVAFDFVFSVDLNLLKEFLNLGSGDLFIHSADNSEGIEFEFAFSSHYLILMPLYSSLSVYEDFFDSDFVLKEFQTLYPSIDAMTLAYRRLGTTEEDYKKLGVTPKGWTLNKLIFDELMHRYYVKDFGKLTHTITDDYGGWSGANISNREARHCSAEVIKAIIRAMGGTLRAELMLKVYQGMAAEQKEAVWDCEMIGRTDKGWLVTPAMLDEVVRRAADMGYENIQEDVNLNFPRFVEVVEALIRAIGGPVGFDFLYENLIRLKDFDFADLTAKARIEAALQRACDERRLHSFSLDNFQTWELYKEISDEQPVSVLMQPESGKAIEVPERNAGIFLDSIPAFDDEAIEVPPLPVKGQIDSFIQEYPEQAKKAAKLLKEQFEESDYLLDETDLSFEIPSSESSEAIKPEEMGGEDVSVIDMAAFKSAKGENQTIEPPQTIAPVAKVLTMPKQPENFKEFVERFEGRRDHAVTAIFDEFGTAKSGFKQKLLFAKKMLNVAKGAPDDELLFRVGDLEVTVITLKVAINDYILQSLINERKFPELDPFTTGPAHNAFVLPVEVVSTEEMFNLFSAHVAEFLKGVNR